MSTHGTPIAEPPEGGTTTGVARALERGIAGLALAAHRHALLTSLLLALALAGAFQFARRLTVDTNLEKLLPPSFQSVTDLETLKDRFGSIGYVLVVAEDAEPAALRRFADDLAEAAAALPSIAYVNARRADGFFREHALYYTSLEDLEVIEERILDRLSWEKARLNPLFVSLSEDGPPSLDFSDMLAKYGQGKLAGTGGGADPYYIDEAARKLVLFIKPTGSASDFRVARETIRSVEATIAALGPERYDPNLRVRLGGRYKKYEEQQEVVGGDVKRTSLLALALILAYLLFHFRRPVAVLLLIAPLAAGLLLTFGLASLLFGVLNILTAFAGSILLGLGIDHGIHLLHRYEHERAKGRAPEDALRATFESTGRGVALAGLTTAIGFFGLSITDFRAFREFGLLAGSGVLLVVLTYALALPPLLRLSERLRWRTPVRPERRAEVAILPGLASSRSPALFAVLSAAIVLLASQAPNLRFQYDFAAMDGQEVPAYGLDVIADTILGHRQTPIVVLTELADEASAAEALRARMREAGEGSSIDFVVSRADLVPADQPAKEEVLRRLQGKIEGVDPEILGAEAREGLSRLKAMVAAKPFGRGDLPVEIQRQFDPREGAEPTGVVLAFPSVSLSDGERVMAMAREVRDLELPGGRKVSAAAEAMILADVLSMVFRESPRVSALTMALVFLSLWALLGRLGLALLCFLPAVITVVGTLGAAPLLGIELNYLNIISLPILFGIAVDAGIHMALRGAGSSGRLLEALRETRGALIGSIATTSMGFGALLFAQHPGLRSLGQVALIGLGLSLVASLAWLPAWLATAALRQARRR